MRKVRAKADCLMNSKSEFHQAPLVRVVALTGLQEEQEGRPGDTLGGRETGGLRRRGQTGRGGAGRRRAGSGGGRRGRGAGRGAARTRTQGQ